MKNKTYWVKRKKEHIVGRALMTKAERFVEANCIKKRSDLEYRCLPIPGYNTKSYQIWMGRKTPDGKRTMTCDCQGFRSSLKKTIFPTCSHIEAVLLYIENKS